MRSDHTHKCRSSVERHQEGLAHDQLPAEPAQHLSMRSRGTQPWTLRRCRCFGTDVDYPAPLHLLACGRCCLRSMPEPRGWRLNRSALLRLLGQAGKKPANAKDLASTALERLAVKHNLVSTASLCDLPDKVSGTTLHSLRSPRGHHLHVSQHTDRSHHCCCSRAVVDCILE